MLIGEGFAIAAFRVSDVALDNKPTFQQGVLQLYPEQFDMDNGMRALGAWGWGASRVMDYRQQDAKIDKNKVVNALTEQPPTALTNSSSYIDRL